MRIAIHLATTGHYGEAVEVMELALETVAEKRALEAENLPSFQGVKLLHIKNTVAELVSLIGREKLFSEYSKHDISHINAMLEMLDWLIPSATAEVMTPADWFMLVLSIYLHDLGMVVTRDEYESRPIETLERFRDDHLFQGDNGEDYRARLDALSPEEQDRFIYEEFIRDVHGQRVKAWLVGEANPNLGISKLIEAEVATLAQPLPRIFRDDLGLVCESHHLDDLGDTDKYTQDKPYGNTPAESVNLQYVAAILRTADLLHITEDRTPPVLFRVINPTNPVSQGEWIKQQGVRAVRQQPRRNDRGEPDSSLQPDTVAVFADFDSPDGFFGLTSYLVYAQREIQRTSDWVSVSSKKTQLNYEFPWRAIDDAKVEARGYLPRPFEFSIDQHRVLDLLTGHTLYNQTDVVVRELVQNSVDAVRLQAIEQDPDWVGRITVEYDTTNRVLDITDNGTGMTQAVIEDHLLKVGSSRYQDPEFRKQHPDFSAISRFGIGVLSAFMIADRVEIVTANEEEDEARELTLRSVHGKYLIRLMPKDSTECIGEVLPHGTRVSLSLRPSASLGDVLEVVENWVVVPRCQISVIVDEKEPVVVGFANPAEAVRDWLTQAELATDRSRIEVREAEVDGVQLAWAVKWSDYFRNWSLLEIPHSSERDTSGRLGMCVEGIRVEAGTPGYRETPFVALGNATGPSAPKTNVARSGLEDTPERLSALRAIYRTLCSYVSDEISSMVSERGLSLTWATEEAYWLLRPLRKGAARSPQDLTEMISEVPTLIVEEDKNRRGVSPRELSEIESFWTIESNTFISAERILRELATDASIGSLNRAFDVRDLDMPDGPTVAIRSGDSSATTSRLGGKEVSLFVIKHAQRRVDLKWTRTANDHERWRNPRQGTDIRRRDIFDRYGGLGVTRIGRGGIDVEGSEGESAVKAFGHLFVLPDTPVADFANRILDEAESGNRTVEKEVSVLFIDSVLRGRMGTVAQQPDKTELVLERQAAGAEGVISRLTDFDTLAEFFPITEFAAALQETDWKVFDPRQWLRSDEEWDD